MLLLLFSCKSVPDDLIMFKDLNNSKMRSEIDLNSTNSEVTIQPYNILRIIVSSGTVRDFDLKEQYNLLPLSSIDPTAARVSSDMEFQQYYVDKNGEIEFPKLGKIKAQGLAYYELEDLLKEQLKEKLSDPFVKVLIHNNRVKVLGEVGAPGVYDIENRQHYSILDAVADAGGITAYGDKKHIKLIREEDGKLQSTLLDLTSSSVFSSQYFYLKQNDVVVVDPNSQRQKDSQYGMSDNYKLSIISTIIGTASTLFSIGIILWNK
jgi:polysaccharide export outer membrane protein